MDRAQLNAALLAAELGTISAQGCYLYWLDPVKVGATAHARFFNPTVAERN